MTKILCCNKFTTRLAQREQAELAGINHSAIGARA